MAVARYGVWTLEEYVKLREHHNAMAEQYYEVLEKFESTLTLQTEENEKKLNDRHELLYQSELSLEGAKRMDPLPPPMLYVPPTCSFGSLRDFRNSPRGHGQARRRAGIRREDARAREGVWHVAVEGACEVGARLRDGLAEAVEGAA